MKNERTSGRDNGEETGKRRESRIQVFPGEKEKN